MTRRNALRCIHEPFGDAFYYGPERLSSRYEDDEKARLDSGFALSTFRTVLDRIEKEGAEVRLSPPSITSSPTTPFSLTVLHKVAIRCAVHMLQSIMSSAIPLFLTSMPQHLSLLPNLEMYSLSGIVLDRLFFI